MSGSASPYGGAASPESMGSSLAMGEWLRSQHQRDSPSLQNAPIGGPRPGDLGYDPLLSGSHLLSFPDADFTAADESFDTFFNSVIDPSCLEDHNHGHGGSYRTSSIPPANAHFSPKPMMADANRGQTSPHAEQEISAGPAAMVDVSSTDPRNPEGSSHCSKTSVVDAVISAEPEMVVANMEGSQSATGENISASVPAIADTSVVQESGGQVTGQEGKTAATAIDIERPQVRTGTMSNSARVWASNFEPGQYIPIPSAPAGMEPVQMSYSNRDQPKAGSFDGSGDRKRQLYFAGYQPHVLAAIMPVYSLGWKYPAGIQIYYTCRSHTASNNDGCRHPRWPDQPFNVVVSQDVQLYLEVPLFATRAIQQKEKPFEIVRDADTYSLKSESPIFGEGSESRLLRLPFLDVIRGLAVFTQQDGVRKALGEHWREQTKRGWLPSL